MIPLPTLLSLVSQELLRLGGDQQLIGYVGEWRELAEDLNSSMQAVCEIAREHARSLLEHERLHTPPASYPPVPGQPPAAHAACDEYVDGGPKR